MSEPGYCSRYSNSLRTEWSGDGIPIRAKFSAPIQISPGAHPASYTKGTRSLSGAKRPVHGINHPPPRAILLLPLYAFMVGDRVNFIFYLCLGNELNSKHFTLGLRFVGIV
jgi:hypothetical protein